MNLNDLQNNASAQASEFAKVFSVHATKIASVQQQWLQTQAEALKAQFEHNVANKDLAATAQSLQNGLQPAAQSFLKHSQALYALSCEAQKELTAKTQEAYKTFAEQANAAVEAGVKQLPNQGEPFVALAKQASQAFNGAFEQIAEQLKTTQTTYEAQLAKLFDSASTAFAPAVTPVKATAKK
jgi:hypothetical protein